jgi:hypothetical protein
MPSKGGEGTASRHISVEYYSFVRCSGEKIRHWTGARARADGADNGQFSSCRKRAHLVVFHKQP